MRYVSITFIAAFAITSPATGSALPAPAPGGAAAIAQDDVDDFMEKVMERRDVNWEATYDYVFNEVELLRVNGGGELVSLQSFEQEYTWYVRDGYLVRSPWAVNGVEVDADERERDELEWIEDVKRDDNNARIERDSFFDFEFEPGNYLFAGRETFEGREVVRIEYYPTDAFFEGGDADDEERRNRRRDRDEDDWDEEEFEHMFAKTSLVSMLVIPDEYQIVQWTFENVGFEFLPYRSLVRMDEIRASMVMDQPIEGVWLPREIRASGKASTAAFDLEVEYVRAFGEYKQPAVGGGVVFGRPKR